MIKSWFIVGPSPGCWCLLSPVRNLKDHHSKYEGGEQGPERPCSFRPWVLVCLVIRTSCGETWPKLSTAISSSAVEERRGGITEGGTVSECFCWNGRKVGIPVMLWRMETATGLKWAHCIFVCVCVHAHAYAWVCACTHQLIFCLPRKQRGYWSTFRSEGAQIECVTYSQEADGRGGGLKSMQKPKSTAHKWSRLKPMFTLNFRPQCHAGVPLIIFWFRGSHISKPPLCPRLWFCHTEIFKQN